MTTITINPDQLTMHAEGHAGAGEKGKDLICASISTVTQGLVYAMVRIAQKYPDDVEVGRVVEDGSVSLSVRTIDHRDECSSTFETAICMMEMIEIRYPKYLKVVVKHGVEHD